MQVSHQVGNQKGMLVKDRSHYIAEESYAYFYAD